MRILGWMHRKLRQNSVETQKDFPICLSGHHHQTLEDFQCHPKGNHFNKPFGKSQNRRNSFANLESAKIEFEQEHDHQSSDDDNITPLFHGFLAIGTLGTEPITNEPATPTFQIDHIAEQETEITEDELKLINDELEKVLGGSEEDEEDFIILSSGRNSHVSGGRISQCSVITISDRKVIDECEEVRGNCNESMICPLQNYLLGSATMGMSEIPRTVMKKEQRTSLGELFQKTKQAEDTYQNKADNKKIDKASDNSAVHIMKKMLKKANVSKNSGGNTIECSVTSEKKKLRKIRRIFSRKVHPENIDDQYYNHEQLLRKPMKNVEIKNNGVHVAASDNRPSAEDDIIIYPESGIMYKTRPQIMSGGNSECWVKTDDDYLVLEL